MKFLPHATAGVLGLGLLFGVVGYLNLSDRLAEQATTMEQLTERRAREENRVSQLEKRATQLAAAQAEAESAPDTPSPIDQLSQALDGLRTDVEGAERELAALDTRLTTTDTNADTRLTRLKDQLGTLRLGRKTDQRTLKSHQARLDVLAGQAPTVIQAKPGTPAPAATLSDNDQRLKELLDNVVELRERMEDADEKRDTIFSKLTALEDERDLLYRVRWVSAAEQARRDGVAIVGGVDPLGGNALDYQCSGEELGTRVWKPLAGQVGEFHLFLSPAGSGAETCRLFASNSDDPADLSAIRYRSKKSFPRVGGQCLCTMGKSDMQEGVLQRPQPKAGPPEPAEPPEPVEPAEPAEPDADEAEDVDD